MLVNVTAKATGGINTTANYAGSSWARLVTLSDVNSGTGVWGANTIAAASFTNGVGIAPLATYTFLAAATAPASVKLRATETSGTDGVDSSTGAEGTTGIRSGRVRLQNAYGSELLALTLPVSIEYYDTSPSTGWRKGTDTCTNLTSSNFAYSYPVSAKNNMSACKTAGTLSGVPPSLTLSLTKPCTGTPCTGNSGWTDMALNVGSTAIGTVPGLTYVKCTAVGASGGSETPANVPWLQFNWQGTGLANPAARATFGSYKSPLIYMRENY
jgi:MSHA biogenesis protein MshQ